MSPTPDAHHDARHRVLGYLVARGVVDRAERERWLNRLLEEAKREGDAIFNSPQATVRAINAFETLRAQAQTSADAIARPTKPWLPAPRYTPMPRQPLGDLPAVLRGSFWSGTARWAWPRRLRARASVAAAQTSAVD